MGALGSLPYTVGGGGSLTPREQVVPKARKIRTNNDAITKFLLLDSRRFKAAG